MDEPVVLPPFAALREGRDTPKEDDGGTRRKLMELSRDFHR